MIESAVCFQETIRKDVQDTSLSDPLQCSAITLEFSDSAGERVLCEAMISITEICD